MNSNTDILIEKLDNGGCTEEELGILFRLVKTLPEKEAARIMEKLWKQVQKYPELEGNFSSKMYSKIISRITTTAEIDASKETKVIYVSRWRSRFMPIASAAAVLVLIVGLSTRFWINTDGPTTFTTAYGEPPQPIELPDGSKVKLNANSTLQFEDKWNNTEDRQVWLEGEAYFEVTKKSTTGQKFQVITPDLTVEVLGTAFNVNSHHDQTKVYLEEGKVLLKLKHLEGQQELMEPGDLFSYAAESKKIITNEKKASQNLYTSWKNGVLVFESTALSEVLLKIEEIYGVEIQVAEEANYKREINTGLPMDKLDIVLPMLEDALRLKIEKEEDQLIIR